MKIVTRFGLVVGLVLLVCRASSAADWADADAINGFLERNFDQKNAGMVVGVVDEQGARVFAAGKLDNGSDDKVTGDTLFEIGSATKTFTALLLLEMADRGEVRLDDPVAKYLPADVKVPSRNGKQITLGNLATQDSGLPFNADNHTGKDWGERFATYSIPRMYDFLGRFELTQDPGEKFQYSNIGMGVLGHALAQRAGQTYEQLIIERICRPLGMQSTCVTVGPELKSQPAIGHEENGDRSAALELPAIEGAGALRSTANDLLKYVSAQLGLTETPLNPLMEKSHTVCHNDGIVHDFRGNTAMPWYDEGVYSPPGAKLLGHAGGTIGYNSFIGLDLGHHRGVVVLTNQMQIHSQSVSWRILQEAPLAEGNPEKLMALRDLVGIGVALEVDAATHKLKITQVIPKSPAAEAGLTAGVYIEKIDEVATAGKPSPDCAKLIRGPEGTGLRLEITDAEGKSNSIELTRKKFRL
jgi:serine-type D-Ala-D-Ala carboxypeptidase/endopeptidase